MTFDPGKLNPAPYHVRESESHRGVWILADANDDYVGSFEIKQEADLAALARNAIDVMIRRGWTPEKTGEGWMILNAVELIDPVANGQLLTYQRDPFTALVEADRWYRENVESSTPKQ